MGHQAVSYPRPKRVQFNGEHLKDLYLVNLPAVVAMASAGSSESESPLKPPIALYWRNGAYYYDAHKSERPYAIARVALFLHQHPGGPLSPSDIAHGAKVDAQLFGAAKNSRNIDYRTLVVLDTLSRAMDDPARPPIVLTAPKTWTHGAVQRTLRRHPGGYLSIKELAQLAGISSVHFERGDVDPYLLVAAENAHRAAANLRQPRRPPERFIALDGMTAILHAIDQHPGGRVARAEFAGLTGLALPTLARDYAVRTLLEEGSARRAAETPPRPPILLAPRSGPHPARAAGLEETSAARWRALAEGRTGPRSVIVIPAAALDRVEGLPELLDRLPSDFAKQVLIWLETDTVLAIQQARVEQGRAPIRVLRRGAAIGDLADYLDWFLQDLGLERVGVLGGDAARARRLEESLNHLREHQKAGQVSVQPIPEFNLTVWLKMLGVPEPVSQQVGLEELQREWYVGSGT